MITGGAIIGLVCLVAYILNQLDWDKVFGTNANKESNICTFPYCDKIGIGMPARCADHDKFGV